MKINLSILFTLLVGTLFSQQNVKIGYTNAEYIAYSHPDYQVITRQLEEHKLKIQSMLEQKYQEFQSLQAEYERASQSGGDQFMIKDIERRAMNKQQEIQQFQLDGEQMMLEKQQSLMKPLQDKIEAAIKEVAQEQGYTHVFDGNSLLYMQNFESYNITDAVLKKLGISTQNPSLSPTSGGTSSGGSSGGSKQPSMLEVR